VNKGQLNAAVAGYLHRTDMGAQIEASIPIANARIGRDLRSNQNLIFEYWTAGDNAQQLPAYFAQIRGVTTQAGSPVDYVSPDQMAVLLQDKSASGKATHYTTNGRVFLPWPPQDTDAIFSFSAWRVPVDLVNDGDSNDVLLAWPQLYVYACLMESFFWTQDGDLTEYARAAYEREFSQINMAAQGSGMGGAPVMRRVR